MTRLNSDGTPYDLRDVGVIVGNILARRRERIAMEAAGLRWVDPDSLEAYLRDRGLRRSDPAPP